MPQAHTHSKPISTKARATAALIKKGEERWKIWERAEGMWEHRKPDPIKGLNKIRKEMARKFD